MPKKTDKIIKSMRDRKRLSKKSMDILADTSARLYEESEYWSNEKQNYELGDKLRKISEEIRKKVDQLAYTYLHAETDWSLLDR